MLLEYSLANFRSFRDEAVLDLRPSNTRARNRYPNNYVTLGTGERVLKTAVIVGENAGGKTNLIESLHILKEMLSRTDRRAQSYPNLINSGNLADADKETPGSDIHSKSLQPFFLEVALDEATYRYRLNIDRWGVAEESLFVCGRKGASQRSVYRLVRSFGDSTEAASHNAPGGKSLTYEFECGDAISGVDTAVVTSAAEAQDIDRRVTLLWMAAIGEANCRRLLDWVNHQLVVSFAVSAAALEHDVAADALYEVMSTDEYLDIVKFIDRSIVGLELDKKKPLSESAIVREDRNHRKFIRPVKDDSAGVMRFLCWAYYVYEVVYCDKTVVADEADSFINPALSDRVLSFINGMDHKGQFIFATHNIFHLTLRTYMKEQINLVTKDPDTLESSLYSVADFSDIRYDIKEELYELYMRGMLGGTAYA